MNGHYGDGKETVIKDMKITIWDLDAKRIARIEKRLYEAMRECGAKGMVAIQSEPPLLSRMNLTNSIPVLEVEGLFWMQEPGKEFDKTACQEFIHIILEKNPAQYIKRGR